MNPRKEPTGIEKRGGRMEKLAKKIVAKDEGEN
jgi:hypothetical protein